MLGATDNRPTSVGVHGRVGGRKSPTLWNIGYMTSQFWDGRVPTLEEQAAGPFFNPGVMDMGDEDTLSDQALRGKALVRKIGCTACHQGVNLAGPDMPMGEPFLQRFPAFTDNVYVDG